MFSDWQYKMLKFLSQQVCRLSYMRLMPIGEFLGRIYGFIAYQQRVRAARTMQTGLGVSPHEADLITQKMFLHLGQTLMEVLYMPRLTAENMRNYVTWENEQYLWDALAEEKGVVLLTAHVGNWEWLGAALALRGFPLATVIKPQPNDQHTRILNEYRQMVGIDIYARGTTELIGAAKAMKKGKVLGFLADQDAGKQGIFASFLGRMASTPLGPAVFAKRFKAPVIPVFIVREQEKHRVLVYPPIKYEYTGDEQADLYNHTLAMTKVIEQTIRQYPEYWMWFQKRWNTPYNTIEAGETQ